MMAQANDTTHNSAVKVLTWNLAGAGTDKSEYKIDKALQEAEALKLNVIAFQETKARSNNWVASTLIKYGHKGWNVSECCNGEGSRNGVAILIKSSDTGFTDIKFIYADALCPNCWEWEDDRRGNKGRVMAVSFKQGLELFVVGNFYAPSNSNREEKASFFEHYSNILQS